MKKSALISLPTSETEAAQYKAQQRLQMERKSHFNKAPPTVGWVITTYNHR
ncbi:MAG: hypothetical protein WCH34_14335 [Bacteroidota bacterium]